LRFRKAILKLRPDVIFAIGTYSNVITSLVAGDTPVLMSEHMNMSRRVQAAPASSIMRFFMRLSYPKRLMVCAAEGITRDLEQNFGVRRSRVIFNGIDVNRVRELAEQEIALPTERPYYVGVGRLAAQKDFSTLIRGFAAARDRGLPYDLVIVGDGDERAMLESLAVD